MGFVTLIKSFFGRLTYIVELFRIRYRRVLVFPFYIGVLFNEELTDYSILIGVVILNTILIADSSKFHKNQEN